MYTEHAGLVVLRLPGHDLTGESRKRFFSWTCFNATSPFELRPPCSGFPDLFACQNWELAIACPKRWSVRPHTSL